MPETNFFCKTFRIDTSTEQGFSTQVQPWAKGEPLETHLAKQIQRRAAGLLLHWGSGRKIAAFSFPQCIGPSFEATPQDVEEEIMHLDDHYHNHMARVRAKFDLLVGAEAWSNIPCGSLLNLVIEVLFVMFPPFWFRHVVVLSQLADRGHESGIFILVEGLTLSIVGHAEPKLCRDFWTSAVSKNRY